MAYFPTAVMTGQSKCMLLAATLACLLTGSAVKGSKTLGSVNIESANYSVQFTPAKRSPVAPWTSHFRVMRKGGSRQTLDVASGVRGVDPQQDIGIGKDDVRLVESADGDQLVIEESIPNDCWMLKNYILISPSADGSLAHSYLRIPEAPHEGIPGPGGNPPAPNDPSTVLSLDGEILTFRFANGKVSKTALQDIPRAPEPRDGWTLSPVAKTGIPHDFQSLHPTAKPSPAFGQGRKQVQLTTCRNA